MSFKILLDEISQNVSQTLSDLSFPTVDFSVDPARTGFGDASCNAPFLLAKSLKKKPFDIASEIANSYQKYKSDLILKIEPHPSGYLNFFATPSKLNKIILSKSLELNYGFVDVGKNSSLIVEHTSVNPNKALHIGHVRNIVIGDVIGRILSKANYDVKILNYVDDSGLQVADIILGFKHLGFSEEPPSGTKFDHYCGDEVYVKTTEKYEQDSSLQDIRKKIMQELEDETSQTAQFADVLTQKVLACQLETCWHLGVNYDCLNFESQIIRSGLWTKIFEKLKEQNLIEFENEGKNSGCWVIRGLDNEEDKVIVRSNGTATYIAKDIPYAAWKLGLVDDPFNYIIHDAKQPNTKKLWKTTLEDSSEQKQIFSADKVITVIDSRQSRLQKIITMLMGKFKSDDSSYIHLGYESVTLSSDTAKHLGLETQGKQTQMSGRKGLYVNADTVIEILKSNTKKETMTRNPDMDPETVMSISQDVAVGTLRYEMIKQDLDKIITFDLTKSLSLEGDTAPYIQYTHARSARILEKSNKSPSYESEFSALDDQYSAMLIHLIGMFEINVRDAAKNFSPKVIARYCHDLAVSFNAFYEHIKVIDESDLEKTNQRLCLVNSFKITLEKALDLLGISAPDRM